MTKQDASEIGIYTRKVKVFLGGTCAGSTWREKVIKDLKINYFNPDVENWNEEAVAREYIEKNKLCDFQMYVITPKMQGVFSIAEVVDASNKVPKRTVFCVLNSDGKKAFDESQKKSLKAVKELVRANGSNVFDSLKECVDFLNEFYMGD
jgi:hypothetical protein